MAHLLANPDVLVLLLLGGLLLIYTEANLPGTIVPGVLGTLAVLLAVFGFSHMALSPLAIAIVLGGVGIMLLEVKAPSHGLFALLGTLLLVWGLLTLVRGPDRIHPAVAIAAGLAFSSITVALAILAARARRNKFLLGPQAMVGKRATVRIALAPAGQVEVRGELWQATLLPSYPAVPAGADVVVDEVDGLLLRVRPVEERPAAGFRAE